MTLDDGCCTFSVRRSITNIWKDLDFCRVKSDTWVPIRFNVLLIDESTGGPQSFSDVLRGFNCG